MQYDEYGYNGKTLKGTVKYRDSLKNVLLSESAATKEEAYYLFDQAQRSEDDELLEKLGLRHDLALLPPGTFGKEYTRTFGHYHLHKENRKFMPEIMQVLEGELLVMIQNFDMNEFHFVKLVDQQCFILPPDYAHVNINIGTTPVVFSSVCSKFNTHFYEPIIKHHGMGFYCCTDGFVKNDSYDSSIQLTEVFGKPLNEYFNCDIHNIYELVGHPELIDFLLYPELAKDQFVFQSCKSEG